MRTVQDLIDHLENCDPNMMVRHGRYETWSGEWKLSFLSTDVLFTDENGGKDLTDKERDQDIECLVIY